MEILKKILVCFVCIMLVVNICACGSSNSNNETEKINKKNLVITTTLFPIYDFVKNITKGVDEIEVNMLLDSGVDLHNFQPSAKDIVTISNSDMFIYVGGESDEWVDAVMMSAKNDDMKVINLIQELEKWQGDNSTLYYESDSLEICGVGEEEGSEHEHEHEDKHEHENEYDEHIWLSLNNASAIVKIIENAIVELDETNKDLYEKNKNEYLEKLQDLNNRFVKLFDVDGEIVFVVADRFPFVYFCEDYGIKYYAAFKGCSSQTDASFKTIKFLSDKADEYNLKSIFKIEKSDTKIAETIISNTKNKNQNILVLNSIQQVNSDEISMGVSYLNLMEENYNVLTNYVGK